MFHSPSLHLVKEAYLSEFFLRFLIGGLVVSSFAVLGDVLKPKSFAGLFSAAPSVALASLGLAVSQHGHSYAATEATAMIAGAAAFVIYAWIVCLLLFRRKPGVLLTTASAIAIWLAVALGLWHIVS